MLAHSPTADVEAAAGYQEGLPAPIRDEFIRPDVRDEGAEGRQTAGRAVQAGMESTAHRGQLGWLLRRLGPFRQPEMPAARLNADIASAGIGAGARHRGWRRT